MAEIPKITTIYTNNQTIIDANLLNEFKDRINLLIDAVSEVPVTIATPVITINGNSATITCATQGVTIYYTLNGTDPTSSSTQYTSAITLTEACTIKAIAIKEGVSSSVASQSYTPSTIVTAPTISVSAGKLTITADAGATIKYTLDGTSPASGTTYSSPIQLTESTTIKAIATKNGVSSEVTTKTYSRTDLQVAAWSDNRVIGSNGNSPSTATDYPGVFSICRNYTVPIPSGVTKVCFTRALLTSSDPDGYTAFYSGESGTMDSTNCVGTPEALPKIASEHGTYDTAEINVPEDGARIRITFWTSLKESAALWYESLT